MRYRRERMRPSIEKIPFLNTPTPLTRMDRISEDLGIDLWLKRDDLTDFGTGGNKLRKLEYFLKDALDQKSTMLLTVGGAQTNHGRLTAAVAARYGMRSAIVAVDEYPGELSANLLLDAIMDCHVYLVESKPGIRQNDLLEEAVARVTAEWESRGESVYYIPMGGSNELGALGYYDCGLELAEQIREHEFRQEPRVVVTVGSMGTYVGLAAAIENESLPMRLTGIGVLPYRDIQRSVADYYQRVCQAYCLNKALSPQGFDVTSEYDYGGYNNPVEDVRQSIYYMGRMEGILLDPCYTGKTFNAIRRMVEDGMIQKGETVIIIHTGGVPGLYTRHHRVEMEEELMENIHLR
jgi:D-cysteine desulfhydrase